MISLLLFLLHFPINKSSDDKHPFLVGNAIKIEMDLIADTESTSTPGHYEASHWFKTNLNKMTRGEKIWLFTVTSDMNPPN